MLCVCLRRALLVFGSFFYHRFAFLLMRVLFSDVLISSFYLYYSSCWQHCCINWYIDCLPSPHTYWQLKVFHLKHLKLQPLNIRLLGTGFIVPQALRNTLVREKATDDMRYALCCPFFFDIRIRITSFGFLKLFLSTVILIFHYYILIGSIW